MYETKVNTVSHFSYAPPFQDLHFFLQKWLNRTFFIFIYLKIFHLFDDIEKYQNHSCDSFCNVKGNFDRNARAFYLRFALEIIHGDICARKTPKTIVLFN